MSGTARPAVTAQGKRGMGGKAGEKGPISFFFPHLPLSPFVVLCIRAIPAINYPGLNHADFPPPPHPAPLTPALPRAILPA